ncbi:hypothetical protein [Maribacter sp. 2307ULW6-5]|uniref:hypothetical protein n=1 Tax=Maribacter sp. 2307ULW6-5 TaxID=3386275 RepID=UPI0039BD507C
MVSFYAPLQIKISLSWAMPGFSFSQAKKNNSISLAEFLKENWPTCPAIRHPLAVGFKKRIGKTMPWATPGGQKKPVHTLPKQFFFSLTSLFLHPKASYVLETQGTRPHVNIHSLMDNMNHGQHFKIPYF